MGMDTTLHIMGMTDEQTECDRCGRMELRCTVILADADGIEAGRYGTTCASKVVGRSITAQSARLAESCRRGRVSADLNAAEMEEDPALIAWWVREIERHGVHRPDEVRRVELLRGVAA